MKFMIVSPVLTQLKLYKKLSEATYIQHGSTVSILFITSKKNSNQLNTHGVRLDLCTEKEYGKCW